MADAPDSLSPGEIPLSNAEFYSPAYLEQRRLALEAAEAAAGFRGIDEFDPTLPRVTPTQFARART